jgi:hypothetical protein
MQRRTWLQSIAALVAARPFVGLRLFAQAPAFSNTDIATLGAIAEVVLPETIGRDGRDRAVSAFVSWVRGYREGADMGHGYGASTLRPRSGSSVAARYPAQLAALDQAARGRGAATFAALPLADRRAIVETFLNEPSPVTRLPAQPTGANVVADFMGSYFTSADAWDVAYGADIGRDRCRALEGSENPPAPLRSR